MKIKTNEIELNGIIYIPKYEEEKEHSSEIQNNIELARLELQKVFEFKYNPDIFESPAMTVSIHKTREGAEIAKEKHKAEKQKELDDMYPEGCEDIEDKPLINEYQAWGVLETELLD